MKTWIKRALRTFFQTAVGYLSVNLMTVDFTAEKTVLEATFIGLGVSAVSAGLAAVMNYSKE